MIRGLRTAVYYVEDLKAATLWYQQLVGHEPYFNTAYYVGFNVGGFELGLHPIERPIVRGDSPGIYWAVDDVNAAWAALLARGATIDRAVEDVGGGIRLATLKDPWGNLLGIIENPSFRFNEAAVEPTKPASH